MTHNHRTRGQAAPKKITNKKKKKKRYFIDRNYALNPIDLTYRCGSAGSSPLSSRVAVSVDIYRALID